MARRKTQFESSPRGKRRVKKRHAFGICALAALLLLIFFLPAIATSRTILSGLIDRFAGLDPLRLEFETVEAGWFTPVAAHGLRLVDANGQSLAEIEQVQTEKGLLGWISGHQNLGTIRIQGVRADVVAGDGTTNLEQALHPILESVASNPPADDATETPTPLGRIEVQDARFTFAEQGRPELWLVDVTQLSVTLPEPSQLIGPVGLKATVSDASGIQAQSVGQLAAQASQGESGAALQVQAIMDQVPLAFWHVVQARVPELPIDELSGSVSAQLVGSITSDSAWSFDVQKLQADNLAVVAPQVVGELPAQLRQVAGAARCSLKDSVLKLEHSQLACDFASATASATLPWPLPELSLADPLIEGGVVSAQGTIDLPKLVAAAGSLIPVRDDTQLVSGAAQFSLMHNLDIQNQPTAGAKFELSDLKAITGGQELVWNEPLQIELAANQANGKLAVGASASAQFAHLEGGGTIEGGQLTGDVDLQLLHQRLSEWVELPIRQMQGTAKVDVNWQLQEDNLVAALGTLNTTPITISTSVGGQLQEPVWTGNFEGRVRLADGSPYSIDFAHLDLKSRDERVAFTLEQPLGLTAGADSAAAGFNVDVQLDLSHCNQRGLVWLTEPPEVQVGGNLQLAARGVLDRQHAELLSANWSSQPLQVRTPQLSFSEPQVVGKFSGRVDTSDLTRLVVETLQVQSTSFSLGAQDSANPDGSASRLGRAMVRVDLDRLMRNVGGGPGAQPTSGQISATGMLHGQLAWQVSSTAAGVNTQLTAENLVILSQDPGQIAPQPIWQEPQVTANVAGTWQAASNAVNVETFQLKAPWLNYTGNVAYASGEAGQSVQVNGQAVYDSGQLSARIQPLTGGQVQLAGQQSVPISVSWTSGAEPGQPLLAGLNASTRLGWEQALVAGIAVGKADVPVQVTAGQLATAAEIPVSGGALRWDLTSDLTADELVIHQKPMTVLDHVEITEQMCQGWLKYVTPLVAEATSVDGRLSLRLDQAMLTPNNPMKQTVVGQIVIHKATIGPGPLSNQVISLARQIEAIRKKDFTQAVSSTQRVWMDMPEQRVDFQMLEGKVVHRNLNVSVGDANISTSGMVAIDGQMEMLANMPIPDDWAEKSPWLAGLRGQSLTFPMRGTLSNPQVDTQLLRQLGRQTLQNAASGLLQQSLNRGLDKLLGGEGAPVPGAAGQNPSGQSPLRGLGGQLLGGEGLNLPGLLPGLGGNRQPNPPAGSPPPDGR